jgi:peptide/nickel transport system substrate-binding protein
MRRRWLIWASLVVLALAGCAPAGRSPGGDGASASGAGQRSGGTKHLVTALRGSPFTLSEAINAAGSGSVPGVEILQEIIHAGVGVEDPQSVVVPRLVTDLPTVENGLWVVNPDGTMQTTFKLRPNVFWHDGAPFTADDLAITVKVAQDKRVAMYGSNTYQLVDRFETPDAQTFVVHWTQPYIGADKIFSRVGESRILAMPRHLLERSFNDDPTTFTDLPYWTSEFVGLGPFKLREIVEGSHMTLDAFDKYFLGRPRLDSLEIKFMLDPNTVAANIMAGAVELTVGGRYSIEWGIQIRDQWRSGRMEAPVATSWVALYPQLLNPTPAVLENVQFRRALLQSLDRQEMSDTIQAGLAPVAHAVIPPNTAEYREIEPSVVKYDYDPRRATQIIESLGYTRGPDGIERDAARQRLSLELRTRQGDDLQEKTLYAVADYFQKIGVATEPFIFPALRANDREFRATRPAIEVVRQPGGTESIPRYAGSETPTAENGYRGVNRSRYRNAEFDGLIDRYQVTIPIQERTRILGEIIHQMSEQVVALGTYWAVDPVMVSNRLVNVTPPNVAWNAHEWDFR